MTPSRTVRLASIAKALVGWSIGLLLVVVAGWARAATVVEVTGPLEAAFPSYGIPDDTLVNLRSNTFFTAFSLSIGANSTLRNFGVFTSLGATAFQGNVPIRSSNMIFGPPFEPWLFENVGTYIQDSGQDASRPIWTTIGSDFIPGVRFSNAGTLEARSGELHLRGDGAHTGSFDVSADAILNFYSGSHTLSGGALSVEGLLMVQDANVTISPSTSLSLPGTLFVSKQVAFESPDPITIGRLDVVNAGTVQKSGDMQIAELDAAGGRLDGAGTTHVSGAATIRGVSFGNPGFQLTGGRRLAIEGSGTLTERFVELAGGTSIDIEEGATLVNRGFFPSLGNAYGNYIFGVNGSGAGAINNRGTFIQDSINPGILDQGETQVSVAFNNAGSVEVKSGILSLISGGNHTGVFSTQPGAFLQFLAGQHQIESPSLQNAGGYVQQAGTDAHFAQASNTGTVTIRDSRFRVDQLTNYDASTQRLTKGAFVIAGAGTLELAMGVGKGIAVNAALVTLDGAQARVLNASSGENALLELRENDSLGSLALLSGAQLTLAQFTNRGNVLLASAELQVASEYVQDSGMTRLFDGTILAPGVILNGGQLIGYGTIDGPLLNGGVVAPRGAQTSPLRVLGSFEQLASGRLEIQVFKSFFPLEELIWSSLSVAGPADLGGELRMVFFGYIPLAGDSFRVLSFESSSGTFDKVSSTGLDSAFRMQALYLSDGVVVRISLVPELSQWSYILPGLLLLVLIHPRRIRSRGGCD